MTKMFERTLNDRTPIKQQKDKQKHRNTDTDTHRHAHNCVHIIKMVVYTVLYCTVLYRTVTVNSIHNSSDNLDCQFLSIKIKRKVGIQTRMLHTHIPLTHLNINNNNSDDDGGDGDSQHFQKLFINNK